MEFSLTTDFCDILPMCWQGKELPFNELISKLPLYLCIFDLNEPWKVDVSKLKSKSKNAAIENRKLQGKVLMTYLKGESVFSLQ